MDWIRKNAFISKLRRHLKPFRLETYTIGVARECYPLNTGAVDLDDQEWAETGRTVITIRLFGNWKGKRQSLGLYARARGAAPVEEEDRHQESPEGA